MLKINKKCKKGTCWLPYMLTSNILKNAPTGAEFKKIKSNQMVGFLQNGIDIYFKD